MNKLKKDNRDIMLTINLLNISEYILKPSFAQTIMSSILVAVLGEHEVAQGSK